MLQIVYYLIFIAVVLCGCKKTTPPAQPADKLIILSPHNEDIKFEFDKAFTKYYEQKFKQPITIEWRDIGSGSSAILRYLQNVYSMSDTSGIDVLFGGGEFMFQTLAEQKLLEKIQIDPDTLIQIPAEFCGMPLYDPHLYWCGSVLSGFGFLHNKDLLSRLKIPPPQTWDDLGKPEMFGLLMLADPSQSGSVAAAYEMIVQSAPDWPSGWRKLLAILSNAADIADSSGSAANAPLIGQAPVAICIDFIGALRAAKNPESIGYVSPLGQTAFTPDPIGILKSPPHPAAAQAFVDFVLSVKGQALWALPPKTPDGPIEKNLGRTPIRRDVYALYADKIPRWIATPYQTGAAMKIDPSLRQMRYGVLILLVQSAAIDNFDALKKTKRHLIQTSFPSDKTERFYRLPPNADTIEEIVQLSKQIKDKAAAEKIAADWTQYFRKQFMQILQSSE